MKHIRLPLIVKILIAIALGVGFGLIAPGWAVRAMNTFDGIFDQLLRFFIPLIIIGLVTPAIAEVGAKAGKMLVITVVLAYTFTVLSGLFAYSFSSAWFPSLLDRDSLDVIDAGEVKFPAYFTLAIPPLADIMTCLVLSFMLGIGIATSNAQALRKGFDGLKARR